MLEDGLHQATHRLQEPLAGIHHPIVIGESGSSRDGNAGIETATGSLDIIEALGQSHLVGMHVGTVGQHLYTHASRELRGQALICEGATGNGLSGLSNQQRDGVLNLTGLALNVDPLRLHLIVGGLSTLHGRRTVAHAVLMHKLHLLPGLLRQLLHVDDNLQLAVEHQQRVIEVGNRRDDVTLHHRLIVLGGDELHLGTALHREQIAEEVYVPRGRDGQRVRLGGGGTIKRLERPLRTQGDRGQEGQFGNLQALIHHVDIKGCIEQVWIVVESLLDECLQLRVCEDATPGQVTKRCGISHSEGVGNRHRVAHQPLRIHLRTLVFVIESAT